MDSRRNVSSNTYPWRTFAKRESREYDRFGDDLMAGIAEAGFDGWEPIVDTADELDGMSAKLDRHGLAMPTVYANSVLHDAERLRDSITAVHEIARRIADLGATVLVTNPSPIRWGGDEDKTDEQLRRQASALDELGGRCQSVGVTLAYHNHDAELRAGAREFHHMLAGTDPGHVSLCLDAHWIYRGCEDSMVAVTDAVHHYGHRVVELHLRQSHGGIWDASFDMSGDIDYRGIFASMDLRGLRPHLVMEQAVETGSPDDVGAVEAHRIGLMNLRRAL